ncbi:MAG TPA: hypothetical protein PLK77_04410 [Pyrinomonadaceae bacterium]|nr:hypothetical protein [Pyrinomonadaceae bacterium]
MKQALSTIAVVMLFTVCSGIANAQPESVYTETNANEWTEHFRSEKELSQFLNRWYLRADTPDDAAKPMTRFEFVDMFYFHLDRLTNLAVFKLKLKNSDDFYAFVRANPDYAINYPYSASGLPAGTGTAVFKDVRRNDSVGYETLNNLGINLCDKDGTCHPEQEVTEKEFYEWVGRVYGVKFDEISVSDKPMTRGKIGVPLVRAIQKNFERVKSLLDQQTNVIQTADIIKTLPSTGRAQITDTSKLYMPDSPCPDLSRASPALRKAFTRGGNWGDFRVKKGDEGDIVFETANTCEKGKIVLVRVKNAIVTIGEKGIRRSTQR